MNNTRWISAIACLLVCAALLACLVGCGEQVTYKVHITTAGARTMTLTVTFDDTATEAEKKTTWDFLAAIRDDRYAAGHNITLSKNEDSYWLEESYDSETEYKIAMGITDFERSEDEVPKTDQGYFVEYRVDMDIVDRATVVGYALRYAIAADEHTLFAWRDAVSQGAAQEAGFAATYAALEQVQTDQLFAATVSAMQKDEAFAREVDNWLKSQGFDLGIPFTFIYDHVYKTVYAKEYDESFVTQEGTTAYVWHTNLRDVPDKTITIYQKSPRVWAWELTALGVGIATVCVLVIVIRTRRKKYAATKQDGQKGQDQL